MDAPLRLRAGKQSRYSHEVNSACHHDHHCTVRGPSVYRYTTERVDHRHSISYNTILRSLYWLKINERIEYKLVSLTDKVLTTSQPDYLHNLISVQSTGRTCSSSTVTLARPSVSSSLQITNHSFRTSLLTSCRYFV